jgi:vanillate/3-O-methylgallate O-demethylase
VAKANFRSLQNLIDEKPDLVKYLSNETLAPMRARTALLAGFVPLEFTNWRDEQRAWRETAVLWDQTHHMPELYVKGPDAARLLGRVSIQNLGNFSPDRAKQFIACTPRGHVVGDCIAFCLAPDSYVLVSGMQIFNWVRYNAETGGYNVTLELDNASVFNAKGRRTNFRFQLEGPTAGKIFNEIVDGGAPEIAFFRCVSLKIGGHDVRVLRHGMAGHMGVEMFGPFDEMEAVRSLIVAAGKRHGLLQGGTKAYFTTLFESGWLPYPFPGIYTGEELRPYREWLAADSFESNVQLAGSFQSSDVEDYYVTPWDLGFGHLLKFDHDFIGREALERMSKQPKRKKMTLVWNRDDLVKVFTSQFGNGPRFKAMEFPSIYFGWPQLDAVRDSSGSLAGVSFHCGYTSNEGEVLSLAAINESQAIPGKELILTWGEPNGGSAKPQVERHEQTTIRVVVAPCPYPKSVQQMQKVSISR